MQIIGNGSYSQLAAAVGLSTNPVLRLVGPSKATLSNFFINGVANTANGIEVTNTNQSGRPRLHGPGFARIIDD